jgi:hypothetical protein
MASKLVALLVACAVFSVPLAARADDDNGSGVAPGLAYATSYSPIPSGTPISVRPWDNSAENQRVKLGFTEALKRRGVPLTDGQTSLILNFETEVDSLAVPGAGPSSGPVRDRNGESRLRMSLWSSTQDSVLTGRRGEGDDDGGSATTRYILRATLDDQSGQRLWQGEATYTGVIMDETATFAAMAPILVDGFGQNVRPKGFRIR